jgi:hypothetical protein
MASFEEQYEKVLKELDSLSNGNYDKDDADQSAALCLLARANLIKIQANADLAARSLKRDIDFNKAESYCNLKMSADKKITETALAQMILKDPNVEVKYREQLIAEKESKELNNILELLKDAHITFRSFARKD